MNTTNTLKQSAFTFLFFLPFLYTQAQQINCNYYTPQVQIDFGTATHIKEINLSYLYNYKKINSQCPDDGYFTYTNYTNNCFNGNWYTLIEDHTPTDINGNMMLVNAAENPGIFFNTSITGLNAGGAYQLATWFVNICKRGSGCTPTPPNILITIFCNGKILSSFETGAIEQTDYPTWKKYEGIFTLPTNTDKVLLQMKDLTIGGCGNDFALDDIELKECQVIKKIPTPPATIPKVKTNVILPQQQNEILVNNGLKKIPLQIKEPIIVEQKLTKKQITLPTIIAIPTTSVLTTRENPIIKWIKTKETEIIIDIYDNGEIDGDTVSIYHNNEMIKSRVGISEKPITLKIKINAAQPHHEITLVANNEGSIPPNTSLMIVTAANKRYEVFITANGKTNAKVVFDLE